ARPTRSRRYRAIADTRVCAARCAREELTGYHWMGRQRRLLSSGYQFPIVSPTAPHAGLCRAISVARQEFFRAAARRSGADPQKPCPSIRFWGSPRIAVRKRLRPNHSRWKLSCAFDGSIRLFLVLSRGRWTPNVSRKHFDRLQPFLQLRVRIEP